MQMYRQQVRGGQDEQASVLGDFVAAQCSPEFLQPLGQMKVPKLGPFFFGLVQNGALPSVTTTRDCQPKNPSFATGF